MKFSYLKKIRTAVSLLFFFSITILFLDVVGLIPAAYFDTITYLQFLPSVLSFINTAGFAAAGFIIILLLTLFFGRVYCSSVCPLGTLQDIIIYFKRKFSKKKIRYKFFKSRKLLRYSILGISVILFLTGNILLLNFLDPFSNSGKILTALVRPILYLGNNTAAAVLEYVNVYLIYPKVYKGFSWPGFIFAASFFILIITLALRKERLFCNTLCPVGAFLGLISKFALFKIKIDTSSCTRCGRCERVCKSNCINNLEQTIDFERCVACYNCLTVCPEDGVLISTSANKETSFNGSKRNFIKNTAVYVLGYSIVSRAQAIIPRKQSKIAENRKYPVSPPGAESTENFNDFCTACHLCISACPTGVLQPSFLEYGFTGMLQPRMDFIKSFCNFECTKCLDVCPTEAIKKKTLEHKKLIQIGKAKFIRDNCIVETEKKDCGACSEHCPTKAVTMVPVPGAYLVIPEVKDEYCIGCGACEYACPTKPYKAIYVEGNPVHQIAQKKKEEKIEQKIDLKEEFPF